MTETVSDVVAARIRGARKAQGWNTGDLAARCAESGHPELTKTVIENIEGGRKRNGARTRFITVDELQALATGAFGVKAARFLDELDDLAPSLFPGMSLEQIEFLAKGVLGAVDFMRWREAQDSGDQEAEG